MVTLCNRARRRLRVESVRMAVRFALPWALLVLPPAVTALYAGSCSGSAIGTFCKGYYSTVGGCQDCVDRGCASNCAPGSSDLQNCIEIGYGVCNAP